MSTTRQALKTEGSVMSEGLVVLILALLLGIQAVSTDLYLPALPGITQGFGATVSHAQLTLSALLLAFGLSQLVWGPLSDRYGRRPILIVGLAGYTLASVGCALAPSMSALIAWRAAQGAAMGAAVMCARAIVRDLYTPTLSARAMSKAFTGLGIMACMSPPLGGLVTEYLGWRWALGVVAVIGAGAFALVALRFVETLPIERRAALSLGGVGRNAAAILRHPSFRANAALTVCTYGGLFTFLATSSFVFLQVLGLTRTEFGFVLASVSVVYTCGTFLGRRMLLRLGLRRTIAWAGAASLLAGSSMGVLALAGVRSPWAIMLPQCLYMAAHAVHQPCGQSGCVAPFPHAAGAASAVNGFLMMVVAFAIGGWVGWRMDGTVFVLVNGVWFWSACLAAVAWTVMQRDGELRRA